MATDATTAERRMIMPKNVVCKKCNNLVNDWCEKVIDSPDQDMQRDCQHFCEKTNAQKIRAMSDEELAWYLMLWRCEAVAKHNGVSSEYTDTQKNILNWLKQPAE